MATYNTNFTDELRARISIMDLVSRRVPLIKKGQKFWGCCPFHNEKTPSFTVDEERGRYHCFGCGESGDIISFTMKTGNMDFITAIRELATSAGIKMPDFKPKSALDIARTESYLNIYESAAKLYHKKLFEPGGEIALEYIKKRGFSMDVIRKFQLGFAPKNSIIAGNFGNINSDKLLATGLVRRGDNGIYDFFRGKLMFPIFNASGQIIAFSGRSLDGTEPKYINTGETEMFHKKRTLFGLNFARDNIHKNNRSIVVEGQIDAIQMQSYGFGETVAPLGTALSEEHIAILCKLNRNIIFCFDGDTAGQKAGARAASLSFQFLRDNSDIRFAFMPTGTDPDEILKSPNGVDTMKKIIDGAMPFSDYFWEIVNKSYLTTTPGGRSAAEKFIKKELEKITDTDLRRQFDKEYDAKKFNIWNKWNKSKKAVDAPVPGVDQITANTLYSVIERFPTLAERHGEFLTTLDFQSGTNIDINLNFETAEKFIVSLKLKIYLEKLQTERKQLLEKLIMGDNRTSDEIAILDAEIAKCRARQEMLILN